MENKERELAAELRTVVSRLVKKLRRESITAQQLSLTERSTLAQLLQKPSCLPSELAAAEQITNQSMSQILANLLERGLISRTGSETDGRKVLISLTEAGTELILQMRHEREEWLAEAINKTCSNDEQAILKQALISLSKIVELK